MTREVVSFALWVAALIYMFACAWFWRKRYLLMKQLCETMVKQMNTGHVQDAWEDFIKAIHVAKIKEFPN